MESNISRDPLRDWRPTLFETVRQDRDTCMVWSEQDIGLFFLKIFQYLNLWKKSCFAYTKISNETSNIIRNSHLYQFDGVSDLRMNLFQHNVKSFTGAIPKRKQLFGSSLVLLRISDLGKILSFKIWGHKHKIFKSTFFAEGGFYDLLWNFVFLVFLCF